jgi:hypothetical protein
MFESMKTLTGVRLRSRRAVRESPSIEAVAGDLPSTDPNDSKHKYWRSVVRMAALCHDVAHIREDIEDPPGNVHHAEAVLESLVCRGWIDKSG